jgi:hypothetical protein
MRSTVGFRAQIHHVTGPYLNTVEGSPAFGRKIVCVHWRDGTRHTMVSYPKFLVEYLLDRKLDPTAETIDHIDGNVNNNDWSNLRIIDLVSHARQEVTTIADAVLTCVWCSGVFTRAPSRVNYNRSRGQAGPFCSRRCSGQYSASVQHKKLTRLPAQPGCTAVRLKREKTGGLLVATLLPDIYMSEQEDDSDT